MLRRAFVVVGILGVAFIAMPSCEDSAPLKRTETYQVDCVAILGTMGSGTPTQAIPLGAIRLSGAPRDKQISRLNDLELGKLCDLERCLYSNGYRRACYVDAPNNSDDGGSFKLKTNPLLSSRVETCYATPGGASDANFTSREDCLDFMRNSLGDCLVGSLEDCARENASGAYAPSRGPSCLRADCGVGRTSSIGVTAP